MTSVSALKRDLEIVRRALNVDNGEAKRLEEDLRILREFSEAYEAATKGMTPTERVAFDIQQAEQAAHWALETYREYEKVFDPSIKAYVLKKVK